MKASDVPDLVALVKKFYEGVQYWGEKRDLDEAALSECLCAELSNPAVFALTAVKENRIVGCIIMILAPDPMLGGFMACKLQWIADPEHGRGEGLKLMREAENWARKCAATRIINGGMSDQVTRLLEASGYTPLEMHYEKRL